MITKDYFKKMLGFNASGEESASAGYDSENNNIESNNSINELTNQEEMKSNDTQDKKARIYNLIIVDESGSMCSLEHVTVTGVNETINSIRGAQREFEATQQHFLTLVTFDSNGSTSPIRTLIDRKPIGEVKDFTNYQPYGGTPLYDAMGKSITALYNHIKDDEDASAVVTVLTDGYENASQEWTAQSLKALIERLTAEGWSFSYMGSDHDVKQVADLLSISCYIEFSHDVEGASNTWNRENSAKRDYFRKMDEVYRGGRRQSKEELINIKRKMAREYYSDRVTPNRIDHLDEGEIFVFGSNPQGFHSAGAAAAAMRNFGAVWGQSEGLQGRSYAIISSCPLEQLAQSVQRFTLFAREHPEMRFLVTAVGCGIAGHNAREVAPMFRDCIHLENVALPSSFWKVLGLSM